MESHSQLEQYSHQHTNLDREDHQEHEHGEKQSVLKKVKAKAKKFKDTVLKKHGGGGHHHPQEHEPRDNRTELHHEEDEDDDDDEDEYEETEKEPEVHGAPIYESQVARSPDVGLEGIQPNMERTDEPAKDNTRLGVPTSHGPVDHQQQNVERIDEPIVGKDVPTSHGAEGFRPELEKITENVSLKEDVGAPKHTLNEAVGPRAGNYEAKVSDPTGAGAEETHGIAPLLHSLNKMSTDDTAPGSHDQVESHDKISADKLAAGSHDELESKKDGKYRDMPDDSPLITGEAMEQDISLQGTGGGYGEKLALATAALGDKAVTAKDAAAAKLGYGDEKIDKTDDQLDQTSQTSYTEKASQAASFLADKAIGVKDAVVSKLGYGGTEEHKTPREPVDHEALMQQTGYIGKVSNVTSAVADKAVEAKNVVASKLGYDQSQTTDSASSAKPSGADSAGGSTIVDKAAQVKNAVASKLKPGDEDRALSELITDSVCKGSPRHEDTSEQQGELLSASKVTESEEVAQRLGTSEEEKRGDLTQIPGSQSPKKGVVNNIKVAVSSLFSGGDQTPTQYEAEKSKAEVRRVQESGN